MAEQRRASSLGELLKQLRADAGLTQEALAESAGLSTRAVGSLERGVNQTARRETARLLADALGLAGPTRAVFEALARRPIATGRKRKPGQPADATPGAGEPIGRRALIGRDGEIAMLAGLMTEVTAGRGGSVLVEGEPGIGKSALVRAALAEAADAGCQVFWGAGDELGQALPLLPLLEGLRVREPSAHPRRNTIVQLLHGEVPVDRGLDVPATLAEQLLALVAEQCAQLPTILIIDDLQWADQASIALWGRLARSVRQMPLLLVGIMRPVPQRDDLRALRRAAGDAVRLVASEAADSWTEGWALHVLALATSQRGQVADALAQFDRALAVTEADPALTDLRLLLQINKAVVLGDLDRYEEALAVARQARHLADQAGTVIRLAQAHSALGQLLFDTGRWDDALAEVQVLPEDLKEPIAACCDLAIAAVICFHRGETAAARGHLAAAVPHARRMGNRLIIGPLALARSMDCEQRDTLPQALAELTAGFDHNAEDLEELEELLADAVRLATTTGDLHTAKDLADHAAALAAGSDIPHRQATALYCSGLLDRDAAQLLAAAGRYHDAGRVLLSAKALEAAADRFAGADDGRQAQAVLTRAVQIYTSLGAVTDVARLQARFRAYRIIDTGLVTTVVDAKSRK
jgi:transcriptional regulator with XRE-family HTH domain/tetratricopeptide (TPR) repeat protein